jgi:hypothetical protein
MEEKDLWSLLRFFLKRLLLFCLKSAYGSFKHFLHHVEVASVDSEIWRRCTGQVLFLLTFKLHFILFFFTVRHRFKNSIDWIFFWAHSEVSYMVFLFCVSLKYHPCTKHQGSLNTSYPGYTLIYTLLFLKHKSRCLPQAPCSVLSHMWTQTFPIAYWCFVFFSRCPLISEVFN